MTYRYYTSKLQCENITSAYLNKQKRLMLKLVFLLASFIQTWSELCRIELWQLFIPRGGGLGGTGCIGNSGHSYSKCLPTDLFQTLVFLIFYKFFLCFLYLSFKKCYLPNSVADPDPGLFYPLDQRSGSGMNFFRILDPPPYFGEIFLHYRYLHNPCNVIFMKLGYS
jgi:hypothetical protein